MITDLFWDIVTSNAVLLLLAAVLVAAIVISLAPKWVQYIWPSAFAYTFAAARVKFVAAALLFFLIGFRVADERAETRQLKNDLAFKELQIEQAQETAEDAKRLKADAEAKAALAKGKLDEFRTKYGDKPEAICAFTPDDLEWLRNIGRTQPK
jgi:hypothetical protein